MKNTKDRDIGKIFLNHLKDVYESNMNKIVELNSICANNRKILLLELLEQNYSMKLNNKSCIPANDIVYSQKNNTITINFSNGSFDPIEVQISDIVDIKINDKKKTFTLTFKV